MRYLCYDLCRIFNQVVAVTDYAEGELFQILEDDGNLPEEQASNTLSELKRGSLP